MDSRSSYNSDNHSDSSYENRIRDAKEGKKVVGKHDIGSPKKTDVQKKDEELNAQELTEKLEKIAHKQNKQWEYNDGIPAPKITAPTSSADWLDRAGRLGGDIRKSADAYNHFVKWGEFNKRLPKQERLEHIDQYLIRAKKIMEQCKKYVHNESWGTYMRVWNEALVLREAALNGPDKQARDLRDKLVDPGDQTAAGFRNSPKNEKYEFEMLYRQHVEKIMGMQQQVDTYMSNRFYKGIKKYFETIVPSSQQFANDNLTKVGKVPIDQFENQFRELQKKAIDTIRSIRVVDGQEVSEDQSKKLLDYKKKYMKELQGLKEIYNSERGFREYSQRMWNITTHVPPEGFSGLTNEQLNEDYDEKFSRIRNIRSETDPFNVEHRENVISCFSEFFKYVEEKEQKINSIMEQRMERKAQWGEYYSDKAQDADSYQNAFDELLGRIQKACALMPLSDGTRITNQQELLKAMQKEFGETDLEQEIEERIKNISGSELEKRENVLVLLSNAAMIFEKKAWEDNYEYYNWSKALQDREKYIEKTCRFFMSLGDQEVPKEIKKGIKVFYEESKEYAKNIRKLNNIDEKRDKAYKFGKDYFNRLKRKNDNFLNYLMDETLYNHAVQSLEKRINEAYQSIGINNPKILYELRQKIGNIKSTDENNTNEQKQRVIIELDQLAWELEKRSRNNRQ